ncbi:hypothetical protein BACCAP_03780 [Pseudoflavonifractor capillosus ATCC 29799]|uniref:Uncharacterized protein n=1 Tax=Pseudoflavonifractor capillosus ATCC 29799 TaxID=411467 RepID=A6NZX5_9FIRM|nr:hypothetical protein BACCAP_03780 [Pseudoflavonifractor capillosus ATCC 29799]
MQTFCFPHLIAGLARSLSRSAPAPLLWLCDSAHSLL